MKKNLFVALAAAVMLLFSACSKDIELAGTTWKTGTITETVTYQGIQANVTMDFTINYTDATNYTVSYTGTVSAYGYTLPMDGEQSGTYVFDGENGVLTNSDGESQTFTYNKKDKTITAVAEVDGFSMNLVFTQQK